LWLRNELGREVIRFLNENKHFKTYSDGKIGWLLTDSQFKQLTPINVTERFHFLYHATRKMFPLFQSKLIAKDFDLSNDINETKKRDEKKYPTLNGAINETAWLLSLRLQNATEYVYFIAPGMDCIDKGRKKSTHLILFCSSFSSHSYSEVRKSTY
jgi:hypothetical protein